MSETIYDCFLSQFNCIKKILASKDELLAGFAEYYRERNPDRLYLIGSGTSYHACSAAADFMEKALNIEVNAIASTCAEKLYGKHPLVIAVSQSGRSTNTVTIVEKLKKSGIPVVTLTDPRDTPVGNAADFPVHLPAENEQVGPKTRGYMATVLMLYLMSMEAGLKVGALDMFSFEKYIEGLNYICEKGAEYIEACNNFYNVNLDNLKKATYYLFVGKGVAAKVAGEDALKVLETLCYPAIGYEYEEFLHGPACSANENLALFLFLSDSDQERMMQTAEIIREVTPNTYIVSRNPNIQGDKILYLDAPDSAFLSPFTDVLPGQLISAKLPETLGRKRHPSVKDIFNRMGTKVKS